MGYIIRLIVTWDVFEWANKETVEKLDYGLIVTWDVFEFYQGAYAGWKLV